MNYEPRQDGSRYVTKHKALRHERRLPQLDGGYIIEMSHLEKLLPDGMGEYRVELIPVSAAQVQAGRDHAFAEELRSLFPDNKIAEAFARGLEGRS